MNTPTGRDYRQIPGTYVFDGEHCRKGYALNMFCKSLDSESNRTAFRADSTVYLDKFELSADQRRAVLDRDWVAMLRLGGNIY
jgi:protocatechuate 4,5-dioxygenase alpha chain